MNYSQIPVDLLNPGQVLASLGFLEAAQALCGGAQGGFEWNDGENARFALAAGDGRNPFRVVLEFLAGAEIYRVVPDGHSDGPGAVDAAISLTHSDTFPALKPKAKALDLPVRLGHDGQWLDMTHWCDASSRDAFKLYRGNRSGARIVWAMLRGDELKKTKGLRDLWDDGEDEGLAEHPFDIVTAMGGSFNFDPRAAWTRLDAGYSPNYQGHLVAASPVVEILAAIGLEHGRPRRAPRSDEVRYSAWSGLVPPSLARAALGCCDVSIPLRAFGFTLARSGRNQVVTFAQEEIT